MHVDISPVVDPEAAAQLSAIGRQSFIDAFGELYSSDDLEAFLSSSHSVDVYERLITDPLSHVWLAETETGDAVGYATAGPCDLPVPSMPEKAGELQRLYLLAGRQSAGVGSRLLTTALDWLDTHFEHVFLGVYYENAGAQRLYRRFGFEKIAEYEFMVGTHADPEWIMQRVSRPRQDV
ncbi:MAG: GNAT family N-acetyltransferase [Pseudomonadota bacterium]